MAKKKSRKSRTSQGLVGSPKRCRTSVYGSMTRALNQQDAWLKGKNVVLTIENPDKTCTNERLIKVNARDYWGLPPMLKNKGTNANQG